MNKLQFSVLASGSRGNAVAVFPGNGPGFLLDCGLTGKELDRRLRMINKKRDELKCTFATHTHKDHFNLKLKDKQPGITWIFTCHSHGFDYDLLHGCRLISFGLEHDVECFGFRVEYNGINIAYVTDTAYIPEESLQHLLDLDALVIEANYREKLLAESQDQYGRPSSRHLSNEQVTCILKTVNSPRLKHVVLTHLSSRYNTQSFAHNAGVNGAPQANVIVSEQDQPTKMITIMRL